MHPKVTILMPNYNWQDYLIEAIESILWQSFTHFEFLIIDDASTDDSWSIIQKYAKQDTRIIAMRNEENMKICKTLNRWLELARGEYIARMDSDDVSLPSRIMKQVAVLENNNSVDIVSSYCQFIDEKGQLGNIKSYPENDKEIRQAIWYRNPILHPGVMFRRGCFLDLWGYDHSYLYAEDYELWVRFGVKYHFYNLQEVLLNYRISGSNTTIKKQKWMIQNTLRVRIKAYKAGYKLSCKAILFFICTWCMQFFPPKFVLWLFSFLSSK